MKKLFALLLCFTSIGVFSYSSVLSTGDLLKSDLINSILNIKIPIMKAKHSEEAEIKGSILDPSVISFRSNEISYSRDGRYAHIDYTIDVANSHAPDNDGGKGVYLIKLPDGLVFDDLVSLNPVTTGKESKVSSGDADVYSGRNSNIDVYGYLGKCWASHNRKITPANSNQAEGYIIAHDDKHVKCYLVGGQSVGENNSGYWGFYRSPGDPNGFYEFYSFPSSNGHPIDGTYEVDVSVTGSFSARIKGRDTNDDGSVDELWEDTKSIRDLLIDNGFTF